MSMRLRVVRDGRSEEVEVAPDLSSVTVGDRTYPATVVKDAPLQVELEVGGERVVVENWPDHFPEPPGPVDVNGERAASRVERVGGADATLPPTARVPAAPFGAPTAGPETPASGAGTPVVPPMPGKVIEVRVAEGARVRAGDVLLVLEAMKMRNEVTSPTAGVVRGLRVTAGASARAREPMLFVAPE
jgi:glutaconyl-CoA/methylmalonyl-CoA decarboxylase subunit gamma